MNHRSFVRKLVASAIASLALLAGSAAQAQGDLLVAPTRVVINGGGNAEVVLSNIGDKPATYRISLELRRMGTDGDFSDVSEANANTTEQAALAMVRHAPRRITLLPGQPQSVRISARPAAELPDGEYRVHMNFRAIPEATPPEVGQQQAATGNLSIRLIPVYGITIPVFVRKGRLEGGAALANPHLVREGGKQLLELTLTRSGQRSVYGEIIGKAGGSDPLFQMRGVAIYPEINQRTVRIPLTAEQVARLKGPIRIEYREMPENGGAQIAAITSAIN